MSVWKADDRLYFSNSLLMERRDAVKAMDTDVEHRLAHRRVHTISVDQTSAENHALVCNELKIE